MSWEQLLAGYQSPNQINTVGQNMNQAIGNAQGMQAIQGNSYSNALNQIAVQNAQDDQAFQGWLASQMGTPTDPTQAPSNFQTAPGGQADASTGSADAQAAPAITGMPVGPGGANPVFPGGVGGGQPMNQVASQYANQGGANPATIAGPGAPQGQPGAGPQPSPQAPSPTGAPSMPGQPMNTAAEAPQGQPGAASGGGQPQQSMNDILARTPPRLRVRMYNWLMQKQAEAQKADQEHLKAWQPWFKDAVGSGNNTGVQAIIQMMARQPGSVGQAGQALLNAKFKVNSSGDQTQLIKADAKTKAYLADKFKDNPDAVNSISTMEDGKKYYIKVDKAGNWKQITEDTKGSGGGLDATQRLIKGVVEEQLDKNGISREAGKSEIAEGVVALKQSEKMDSPERERQVIREAGAKQAAASDVKREEAERPFPSKVSQGVDNLVGDITNLRLGPTSAMSNFVQRMGGANAGTIRLEVENRIKAKYPNFDITKADAYAQQEKRPDLIRAQENIVSVEETIQQVKKLIPALQNKDMRAYNEVNQWWKTQFGSSAPTNWQTAAVVTATEMAKAANSMSVVVPTGRFEKEIDNLKKTSSPQQLYGSMDTNLMLLGPIKRSVERMRHPYTKEEILGVADSQKGSTTDSVRPKNKNFDQAVGYLKAASDRTDAIKRASSLKARGWSREDLNAIGEQAGY